MLLRNENKRHAAASFPHFVGRARRGGAGEKERVIYRRRVFSIVAAASRLMGVGLRDLPRPRGRLKPYLVPSPSV